MEEKKIIESLSPLERNLIKHINSKYKSIEKIGRESGLDFSSTKRGIEFLKRKGVVDVSERKRRVVELGVLGVHYLKNDLPERVLLNLLLEKKSVGILEIKKLTKLNDNEIKAGIGVLKKKAIASIKNGNINLIEARDLSKKMAEEMLLEKLPLNFEELSDEDRYALKNLLGRKDIVLVREIKIIEVKLNSLGEELSKKNINEELIEYVSPDLIKKGLWKKRKFRRYDLKSPVPRFYGGKSHFVNQAKEYARKIWLEMGFKEMKGRIVESSFWVFDALFTPQDHPVREMQDTFYLKNLKAKLPEKKLVEAVRKSHEGGVGKSRGWCYKWRKEEAEKVVLRTHTTSLSARTLREIGDKKEFPAKYFALGKCFRNETVNWSHSFEFNQTEGIVVDENANFRQLLGYLIEFYKKMGYEKIRIRPGYFAYTEPSLEIDAYNSHHKKWIELGGAGMMRPEVTIPLLGKHVPVLAWGPGFDRIIMEYFEINDIRELYDNDITKLRNMKLWMK